MKGKQMKNNILIKNIDILIENQVTKDGMIYVEDKTIKYIGKAISEKDLSLLLNIKEGIIKFDNIIDGKNKLAMPGLVNCHSHSPMTLFRNYADDLAFTTWLFEKIIPLESKLTEEMIYSGAKLAIAEMIKSGTTLFMDMYMKMDKVAEAVVETGIKACISKDILTSSARGNGLILDKEGFFDFYKNWNMAGDERIKVNMEVHSVYLYDEPSLRMVGETAKEHNLPIHIHLLEGISERDTSMEMYGKDPIDACLSFGLLDVPVMAAHCVQLNDSNFKTLKEKGVSVIHNPTSNLKLGNGIANVPKMLEHGINVTLGTDGAASNNNLNLFEEIHLAGLLHKGISHDPTAVSADEVLRMATINGAKSLGFNDTGILKEGAKADIILIDLNKPNLRPIHNYSSALVYSASGADVDTVIVDGKILMENRELKTIDEEKVIFEAEKYSSILTGDN